MAGKIPRSKETVSSHSSDSQGDADPPSIDRRGLGLRSGSQLHGFPAHVPSADAGIRDSVVMEDAPPLSPFGSDEGIVDERGPAISSAEIPATGDPVTSDAPSLLTTLPRTARSNSPSPSPRLSQPYMGRSQATEETAGHSNQELRATSKDAAERRKSLSMLPTVMSPTTYLRPLSAKSNISKSPIVQTKAAGNIRRASKVSTSKPRSAIPPDLAQEIFDKGRQEGDATGYERGYRAARTNIGAQPNMTVPTVSARTDLPLRERPQDSWFIPQNRAPPAMQPLQSGPPVHPARVDQPQTYSHQSRTTQQPAFTTSLTSQPLQSAGPDTATQQARRLESQCDPQLSHALAPDRFSAAAGPLRTIYIVVQTFHDPSIGHKQVITAGLFNTMQAAQQRAAGLVSWWSNRATTLVLVESLSAGTVHTNAQVQQWLRSGGDERSLVVVKIKEVQV